jgi:YbbR domain-containing protein
MSENNEMNKNENTKPHSSVKSKDLLAKIICVIFAIFLWFYVVSSQKIIDERKFTAVPIKLERVNMLADADGNKMSVIEGLDYTVDIVLTGTLGELNRLDYDDIIAYVDMSSVTEAGEQILEVNTRIPGSLTVKEMSTSAVSIYVDRTGTRSYEIAVEPVGYSLESGYIMEEPVATPAKVTVSGPLSVLEKISSGKVDVVCGNLTNSIEVKGSVYLVDENDEAVDARYLEFDSGVTVEIPVMQTKNVTLDVEFKHGYHSKGSMPYTITPAYITVKGEPNVIKTIEDPFILTVLDEKEIIGNGKYTTKPIEFKLPRGVEVVNAKDAVVEVNLSNLYTDSIYIDKIKVQNDKNLSYSLTTAGLVVTFRGSTGSLAMLKESGELELEIDISDYIKGAGKETVPAKVIIPDNLSAKVYEIGTYEVDIEIY